MNPCHTLLRDVSCCVVSAITLIKSGGAQVSIYLTLCINMVINIAVSLNNMELLLTILQIVNIFPTVKYKYKYYLFLVIIYF